MTDPCRCGRPGCTLPWAYHDWSYEAARARANTELDDVPIRSQVCPTCDGEGCPYCGGPEHDYHTACFNCSDCGGTGFVN